MTGGAYILTALSVILTGWVPAQGPPGKVIMGCRPAHAHEGVRALLARLELHIEGSRREPAGGCYGLPRSEAYPGTVNAPGEAPEAKGGPHSSVAKPSVDDELVGWVGHQVKSPGKANASAAMRSGGASPQASS